MRLKRPYKISMNIIQEFPIPQKDYYKVYVSSVTFNQAPYIEDCLNGVAMQETNFPFVHHVIDDASTDGEQDVIKTWMARKCDMENAEYYENDICTITIVKNKNNPNCTLAAYFLKKNMYGNPKKGELYTPWREVCPYEALCEGDDYWIDPKKLQNQVDYLDEHPDVVYSCTRFNILIQDTREETLAPNYMFDQPEHKKDQTFVFTRTDAFTKGWITKTVTCLYRITAFDKAWYSQFKYARDVHMVYSILSHGNGVCQNFVSCTYRINNGGIYGGLDKLNQSNINYKVYDELYAKINDPILIVHRNENYRYLLNRHYYQIPKNIEDLKCWMNYIKSGIYHKLSRLF